MPTPCNLGAHQDCVLWRKPGANQKPATLLRSKESIFSAQQAVAIAAGSQYNLLFLLVIGAMENQLEYCSDRGGAPNIMG